MYAEDEVYDHHRHHPSTTYEQTDYVFLYTFYTLKKTTLTIFASQNISEVTITIFLLIIRPRMKHILLTLGVYMYICLLTDCLLDVVMVEREMEGRHEGGGFGYSSF